MYLNMENSRDDIKLTPYLRRNICNFKIFTIFFFLGGGNMFEGYSGLNCLHTISLNSYIEIFADFFKCFDKVESQSVQLYTFVLYRV